MSKERGIIKHFFVGQNMEVKDVVRKLGDGKDVVINDVGVIHGIRAVGDDIAYVVEFDIELEHTSPYGSKWKSKKNSFIIFHNIDKDKIVNVV